MTTNPSVPMNSNLKGITEEDWPDPGELATGLPLTGPQYVPKHGVKSFCCGAQIVIAIEWHGWKCEKCGAIQTLNPDTGVLVAFAPLPWRKVLVARRGIELAARQGTEISEASPDIREGKESSQQF